MTFPRLVAARAMICPATILFADSSPSDDYDDGVPLSFAGAPPFTNGTPRNASPDIGSAHG